MFIEKARKIHGDKYDYSLVDYKNNKTKVKIICKLHGVFLQTPDSHLRGRGCPKCGRLKRVDNKIKNQWKETLKKLNEIYNYDFSNSVYINARKKIKFVCALHGEVKQRPNDLLNGHGCPICGIEKRNIDRKLTIEEIKQRSIENHGDVWDFLNNEYKNIYSNIKVRCKVCGKINYKPAYRIIYGKCCYCSESQGERAVRLYLEKLGIRYFQEHTFKDCKYKKELPFDFYLPDYNTVIEYQGEQHFREILFFEKLEDRQLKDKIKREYCLKNGIREIEIKYNEKIEEKIWQKEMIK